MRGTTLSLHEPTTTAVLPPLQPGTQAVARLVVVSHSSAAALGCSYVLAARAVVMGRSPDVDFVLDDEGLSRRHAMVTREGADYVVEDLGSTNGTYLNGVRIQRATISDGDRLQVGANIVLRFAHGSGLELTEQSLFHSLDAARVGTFRWEKKTRSVRWSEHVERMLGIPVGALSDSAGDLEAFVHADDRARVKAALERTLGSRTHLELDFRLVWNDLAPHWVSLHGDPLCDHRGEPAAVAGLVIDAAVRKREEEELRRHALMFASLDDGVMVLDADGHIVDWNKGATKLFGYEREEVLGLKPSAALWSHGALWDQAVLPQVKERGRWLGELDVRRKCGGDCSCEVTVLPMSDGDSAALGFIALHRDIRARKKLEIELRQAQKLESVGKLASGVAHEINTPVQFVSDSVHFVRDAFGDLQTLLARYHALHASLGEAGGAGETFAEQAAQAREAADLPYLLEAVPKALERALEGLGRVAEIVQSMKAFAHPDQREMTTIDVNRAVSSTLTMARNEYKYVAELETELGEVPLITGHAGEINQVILNIVVNAAHAIADVVRGTAAKGRITVRTRREGDWVVISIGDTGAGIPEEIRSRVFDPFFTTKEVGRGSGQGLAIAHAVVVEKHKGTLSFESQVGVGTTFFVRLPIGT